MRHSVLYIVCIVVLQFTTIDHYLKQM